MKFRSLIFILCLTLLTVLMSGCAKEEVQQTEPPAVEVTETTVPVTTPPDGDPDDVTCKGSYTVSDEKAAVAAGQLIATVGSKGLTADQLQVYYWLEVAAWRQDSTQEEPDFSQPLDTQVCTIDSSVGSWQQYFLREALNAWHAQQALALMAAREGVPTEEAYQPDQEKHAAYMPDKPAAKYLYGHSSSYRPNDMHQVYLDTLPETLDALAADNGFADADAQARAIAGPGVNGKDLVFYAQNANFAYMYFTEMGYHFEPTAEEVESWYTERQSEYEAAGISKNGEKTVDIRHILVIPGNAEIAADGTVTCSEEDWEQGLTRAKSLKNDWNARVKSTRYAQHAVSDPAEARFSEFAKDNSADEGSRINGGLYVDLQPGQLPEALDSWCFDEARQHGDVEILRSECGWHIVFFSGSTENWYAAAEEDMRRQYFTDLISQAMEAHPMEVDYGHIVLGQPEDNGSFVTPAMLLYADVAHERYPKMPLYLQQDYPDAPYGNYKLSTHGCGITTLAMVASYLTDEELTPVELAARYGYYCGPRGTEIVIFDDTPAEMGFHLDRRAYGWREIDAAVRNGQIAISLQWAGYWTSGGHYLAITEATEDGLYVVRDSNLLNYRRIEAHKQDSHTAGSITAASQYYWIYEKKVTRIPACVRCAEEDTTGAPDILFGSDYYCAKCHTAMTRRDAFLQSIAG